MEEEGNIIDKILASILKLIYSKDKKYERYLFLLIIAGFALRLVAALHLDTLADDMVYASQSAGVIGSNILSTNSNPPLFFYLNDLAYKIFGYTTLASRFWPLIFGTLLIAVTFLITRKLFNEKVALASAFFVTFCSFLIRMTFTEQSLVVFFFIFSGIYFGMCYLDDKKLFSMLFSGIFFGLALLTKYNAPFFIISLGIFGLYYNKLKFGGVLGNIKWKHIWLFLLILVVLAMPFLAFNYLLYQDKGIVDVYFSRIIHIEKANQLYGGLAGQENSFFSNVLNIKNYYNYILTFKTDLIFSLFGLIGLFLFGRRKLKVALAFFIIFLIIPFIAQSAGAPLEKHFAFMYLILAVPAGYSLDEFTKKINSKALKFALFIILTALFIFNLGNAYGTPENYLHSSETSQLKSFINENIKENDIILLDSRIYSARAFWLATPHHFLTLQQFPEFYNINMNLSQKIPTAIYTIECVTDDCGWGWVAKNQELNQTSELILDAIKERSNEVGVIESYIPDKNEFLGKNKSIKYKIYSTSLEINPALTSELDNMQAFYFVPYLYKNMNSYVFNYKTAGLNTIIDWASLKIIYIAILLSIIAIIIIIIAL